MVIAEFQGIQEIAVIQVSLDILVSLVILQIVATLVSLVGRDIQVLVVTLQIVVTLEFLDIQVLVDIAESLDTLVLAAIVLIAAIQE